MALGPWSFSDHLPIERLPIAMLPLPERILAAFQDAADGLADARPQDSSPSAHSRLMASVSLGAFSMSQDELAASERRSWLEA